jgi:hypothetical protein
VGKSLWAVNKSFGSLCFGAIAAAEGLGKISSTAEPTEAFLDALIKEMKTNHPVASLYPPSRQFLRLVLKNADGFFKRSS